jgi:hypothetical protein
VGMGLLDTHACAHASTHAGTQSSTDALASGRLRSVGPCVASSDTIEVASVRVGATSFHPGAHAGAHASAHASTRPGVHVGG